MSGIYIKGMEMPKCHFKTSESYNVHGFWIVYPDGTSKLRIFVGNDLWECGAIPVPDHGRLIDADALVHSHCHAPSFPNLCKAINAAPVIIPADKEDLSNA